MTRHHRAACILVAVAAVCGTVWLRAQTPAVAFDVASIKPNTAASGGFSMVTDPGGRFTATRVSPQQLVLTAYQLRDFELSGAPSWMVSERYDIQARANQNIVDAFTAERRPGPSALNLMLRALLVDRFKLASHIESRELPVYVLVMARTDRRLGPHLSATTAECAPPADGRGAALASGPSPCSYGSAPGRFTGRTITMFQFANALAGQVSRTVIDRTGLTGNFDIDLTWTPDRRAGADEPAADPNGASIFTATVEQLGLKLDSARGPVDVLVIDHVERPTADQLPGATFGGRL